MRRMSFLSPSSASRMPFVLIGALAAGCTAEPPAGDGPPPEDTDTSDPRILPIDTTMFIPQDTAPDATPDLVPDNWVYIVQQGSWATSGANMTGTLRLQEYVDELDTAEPNYECDVVYSLTGNAAGSSSCPSCDFVYDIEHFVSSGDPTGCHDVDAPQSGEIWQMGFDGGANKILLNYHGTDVWLEWYDATQAGYIVTFDWSATLAIEVEDSGMM
jgi:hypothetical protein